MGLEASGCATQPVVTRTLYEDRSMWIRLEKNLYAEPADPIDASNGDDRNITAPALATWLKGFRVLTDRGVIGMTAGKEATTPAFVEQEILALTPHLAKALAKAKPDERVAYCFAADRNSEERYITTATLYVKKPYLYYKLDEYRTLVRVPSLSTSTSEACMTKPQPGYKTADRYFRLEYEPEDFVVGETGFFEKYGSFMAATIMNGRGEVVFRLSTLVSQNPPDKKAVVATPSHPVQEQALTAESASHASQPIPASIPTDAPLGSAFPKPAAQLKPARDASPSTAPAAQKTPKPMNRTKPKPSGSERQGDRQSP
jgi:hypothetical protein